ncbi:MULTISPECIES: hypothetical protein [Fictibacillus]|uniref:hypothetical protein n=1 Tax=Fictibacillus TaxID=1329200 RepID=UPI0008160F96|nr:MULTISPECIES: hypothetical protein [Fictibacillus]SCC33232.1 hypothetical protein GA0061096_3881 [Fictibacillus enclensis]
MSRGKEFEHKKKGHPGNFPEGSITSDQGKEKAEVDPYIVTNEAFKNRKEEE